jgi:hypothetical protein
MAYSGQARIAFETGFNDALFGRDNANPYDQSVVGKSWTAYEDGYAVGLISDTPPRGPKGDTGDTGPAGAAGAPGAAGTDGADGNQILVGAGAPGAGLGSDGDQYIDSDSGDIYTKVTGSWSLQGNLSEVALTTRTDTIDPTIFPEVTYRGDAIPGTAESTAAWRVTRLTMQDDGDIEVLYADGNDTFDNRWDQHLSLSYS